MIKIKKFDKIVEQAQKRISNQEIQSTKKAIDMIFKTIKSVIYSEREKLTENSKDDISQISYKAELAMQKILRERLMKVSEDVPIENEAHILNAYQELLYNHAKRKEIYNKIKGVETSQLEKGDLGNNIEKNEEFIMKQILYMYRSLGNTTFIREYEGLKVAIQRKNPKQELIEEAFLSSRDIFSENIRKRYITGLKTIGEIIKYFGFFGEYEKRENSRLEKIGIERSKKSLEQADVILFVLDGSKVLTDSDLEIKQMLTQYSNVITIVNKIDKERKLEKLDDEIVISALKEQNIEKIKDIIYKMVMGEEIDYDKTIITNERQISILHDCKNVLNELFDSFDESMDIIAMLIKKLWNTLGKITGQCENEQIIDLIFSKFCLGK